MLKKKESCLYGKWIWTPNHHIPGHDPCHRASPLAGALENLGQDRQATQQGLFIWRSTGPGLPSVLCHPRHTTHPAPNQRPKWGRGLHLLFERHDGSCEGCHAVPQELYRPKSLLSCSRHRPEPKTVSLGLLALFPHLRPEHAGADGLLYGSPGGRDGPFWSGADVSIDRKVQGDHGRRGASGRCLVGQVACGDPIRSWLDS